MMRHRHKWCQNPPSVTVWVKPNTLHSHQARRGLRLKNRNGHESQDQQGKSHQRQQLLEMYNLTVTVPRTIVIQCQEMSAFFRLFDNDLIQDFLLMDCCYKLTDKYLLAMTFVYFKRARFTIAEYTVKNLFIALYLANTMEEDEEENKYEIFPWALGKNWVVLFPHFVKQRDKLWVRIEYRAAVSRCFCEEVMALVPSHALWQRNRPEHHGFSQRQYGDQVRFPRGPSASPVFCAPCSHRTMLGRDPGSELAWRDSSARTQNPAFPFISAQAVEITPPKATACWRKTMKTKDKAQTSCCCAEEVPEEESLCRSTYDASMDWINEE